MAKTSVKLCPHCCTSLSQKSYDTHKRLFYDSATNQWIKEDHQRELTSTEQAIEECDTDFITDEHPPPLVDFGDDPNFSQDSDAYFEADTEDMFSCVMCLPRLYRILHYVY